MDRCFFLMAAKPPYIKSRSDFIGAVSARFCDVYLPLAGSARDDGGNSPSGAVAFTFLYLPAPKGAKGMI
jgi:hypothetical protein